MNSSKPQINLGDIQIRFFVESDDSLGSATVFECSVASQARVPVPHSHDGFEETIYGLEGTTTWTVDGTEHAIGVGDCICIQRGQIHGFENRDPEDSKFLAIASPGVFGPSYFEDLQAVVAAAQGPPDPTAIVEVMKRHGLTPAPPVAA